MDLNKLTMPEKIISASAIVLLLASFLTWFKVSFLGVSVSFNGWDVGFLWCRLPVLLGIVMLAHIVIKNFFPQVNLPDAPWDRIHLGAGVLAAVLVVLKLLVGEEHTGVDFDRGIGLILGALAAIGLGVGGFLYYKAANGSTSTTM